MLECFLVVALTQNGNVVARNLASVREVPESRIEMRMALEAGRRTGDTARFVARHDRDGYKYGYDCGGGWIDRGVKQSDVF